MLSSKGSLRLLLSLLQLRMAYSKSIEKLKRWNVGELSALLGHPELKNSHSVPEHTISAGKPSGTAALPFENNRKRPMRRRYLKPTEPVDDHRYVNYRTDRRELADIAQMANEMFSGGNRVSSPDDNETNTETNSTWIGESEDPPDTLYFFENGQAEEYFVNNSATVVLNNTSHKLGAHAQSDDISTPWNSSSSAKDNKVLSLKEGAGPTQQAASFVEPRDPVNADAAALTVPPAYKPFRMHFDVSELLAWKDTSPENEARIDFLTSKVLPGMATVWSAALNVIPVDGPLKIDFEWCPFGKRDNPPFQAGVDGTDLVVFITANSEVCAEKDVLASAFACYWDQYERPVAGNVDFCLDSIETEHLSEPGHTGGHTEKDLEALDTVLSEQWGVPPTLDPRYDRMLQMAIGEAVHEFAHVLGVTPADLLFFYDWETGEPRTPRPVEQEVECVGGERQKVWMPEETTLKQVKTGSDNYFVVTLPSVRQVVRNQFNCQSLEGARLDNRPTNGDCFGAQFDERQFFTESTSSVMGGVSEILSPLILSLLHDSGWYVPNYAVAKVSSWGHGAGCSFVEEDCIQDGKVPDFGDGYFCDHPFQVANGKITDPMFGCDPTYTHIGICNLFDHRDFGTAYGPPPEEYSYFPENPNLGSLMGTVNYCPTYTLQSTWCREISMIADDTLPELPEALAQLESTSHHAKCLPTIGADRPICLDAVCDVVDNVIKFKAGDKVMTCFFDGQELEIAGTGVSVRCPRVAAMCPDAQCPANCSGQGVCEHKDGKPICVCHDPTDKTDGCYASFKAVPPGFLREAPAAWRQHSAGQRTSGTLVTSLFLLWACWSNVLRRN